MNSTTTTTPKIGMRLYHSFKKDPAKILIAAVFLFIFGVIVKTFRDYGVTWDEGYHQDYGAYIVRWYLSFFNDTSAIRHVFLVFYGGFFDTFAHLAGYLSPWGTLETRHLLDALFGLWTVFMSYKIARHIAGSLAGFFAALFLILQPVFYGHMFNNPVDVPFGAMFITTLCAIVTTYDRLPKLHLKDLIAIGVPLGLTLGIRISGMIVLLPCLAVAWLGWLGHQAVLNKWDPSSIRKVLIDLVRNLAGILIIAWPVMLLWWPWAQLAPFTNPWNTLLKAAQWNLNPQDMTVLFDGKYYGVFQAPRYYLLQSILVTLPEFFFLVLFMGGLGAVSRVLRDPKLTAPRIQTGLLVFAFIFPVVGLMLSHAPQFDGYRHFLFLMPLLSILAGISFAAFLRSRTARAFKILLCAAVTLSLLLTIADMRRLHPYETVYFNRFPAGGLAEAANKYETDYWGNSYREGILWVIQNYHPGLQRKIRVMNSSEPFQTAYYLEKTQVLRDKFEMVKTDPDIFLATTRWGYHKRLPGKVLYTVERDHTPLLYVIEVTKPPA